MSQPAITVLLSLLFAAPVPHPACSIVVAPGYTDNPELSQFTARALEDTLYAGIELVPASVRSAVGSRDDSATRRDFVWGQAVVIDRIRGRGERLLDDGPFEAVLVPWGYDSACEPIHHWRGLSNQWVAPSTRGVFMAPLRPVQDWVDGLPTFDVPYALHFPVTSERGGETVDGNETMSPDRYFDLLEFLNSFPDEDPAYRAYRRWAEDHPDLVREHPAAAAKPAPASPSTRSRAAAPFIIVVHTSQSPPTTTQNHTAAAGERCVTTRASSTSRAAPTTRVVPESGIDVRAKTNKARARTV
jgi:hypothetical protein